MTVLDYTAENLEGWGFSYKFNCMCLFVCDFSKQLRMSEVIEDMVAYAKLTDGIFERILYSTEPELEESRQILQKILRRELYKCVGQTKVKEGKNITKVNRSISSISALRPSQS